MRRRRFVGGFAQSERPQVVFRRRLRRTPGSQGAGCKSPRFSTHFGSSVHLFEAGPRILMTEEQEVAAVAAAAFRERGMVVRESFGAIDSFEKTPTGVRMNFSKDGKRDSIEAALALSRWVGSRTPAR
jgi:pyruvate/2-oxoglutarate dehydrogenase complex dihydrolipoamide dehydrogenase (E3) component